MSGVPYEHSLLIESNNNEFLNRSRFFETDDTESIIDAIADKEHSDWLIDLDESEFNEGC